ncbi:MAG: hypothetical protein JSV68_24535, partial [Anaerolineaceae bacterium]
MRNLNRRRLRGLLVVGLLLLVVVTSCQSTDDLATASPQVVSVQPATATALPTATLLSPVVNTATALAAEPLELPAFSLVDVPPTIPPTDTPKEESAIDAKPAPTGTPLPTATPMPTETPSPTP